MVRNILERFFFKLRPIWRVTFCRLEIIMFSGILYVVNLSAAKIRALLKKVCINILLCGKWVLVDCLFVLQFWTCTLLLIKHSGFLFIIVTDGSKDFESWSAWSNNVFFCLANHDTKCSQSHDMTFENLMFILFD